MKVIKKNVYYCDHCSKKSLAAHVITKHEKGCTANPERECKLCENVPPIHLKNAIEAYKTRFVLIENNISLSDIENGNTNEYIVRWTGEPVFLKEIEETFDNCPNCVLAFLRQSGMNKHYFGFKYDYMAEFERASRERNERIERDRNYYDT